VLLLYEQLLTAILVLFPATGHRLDGYNVEGHAIADIKVDEAAPTPLPQSQHRNAPPQEPHPPYPHYHQSQGPPPPSVPTPRQAPQPFVDPAILSVGKRASAAPSSSQPIAAPPQEAPATPIKPMTTATAAPLPTNTSPFIGAAKERNIRKPSAATLEGPFSSLNIADAEEPDSNDAGPRDGVAARRASITKTRTGKPMDDTQPIVKGEDSFKRTRRGGKARKKEVAAQERRNGADPNASPEANRKGYVLFRILLKTFDCPSSLSRMDLYEWIESNTHPILMYFTDR
jgi:enhancer of mRNA-decapping protein 3